jgi:hypothetical protein
MPVRRTVSGGFCSRFLLFPWEKITGMMARMRMRRIAAGGRRLRRACRPEIGGS